MKDLLVAIWALLLLSACTIENKPQSTAEEVSIGTKLQRIFDDSSLPGASLVVVNDESVLLNQSYGFSNAEQQIPFTNNSSQNIGSISKTFIALAMMQAVEQGKLDIDADINDYLPFQVNHPLYPDTPITMRHLSHHASGIIDSDVYAKSYVFQPWEKSNLDKYSKQVLDYFGDIEKNQYMDDTEFLRNVLSKNGEWYSEDNFSKSKPGESYSYTNIGASLAALVIESAVNMPYESFTRRHIFEPLQMSNTGWRLYGEKVNNHNKRYLPPQQLIPDYHLITKADGGLVTNSNDFGKYLIEMMKGFRGQGQLLSASSYQQMFTSNEYGDEKAGLFWEISDRGQPNHNGADPGVLTITIFDPVKNLGYFVMFNVSADEDKKMIDSLRRINRAIRDHNWQL